MTKKTKNIILAIIPFVFYITFFFIDGYVICDDSESYIIMHEMREPLYPLVIDIFRKIIGVTNNTYLYGVVLFQSLLAAYITFNVTKYISEEFKLNEVLKYFILLIILSVSLLCRFAAKRGSMYTNSILSEGLAYPLFILFIRYDLDYLINNSNKPLVIASCMSLILISIRKQMYLSLMLLVITIIFVLIKKRNIKKCILIAILVSLCIYGGSKLIDRAYTSLIHNTEGTHTGDNRFLTTMVFYVSNKEDVDTIDDVVVKELFLETYDICNKNNYLKSSSNSSWYDRVQHFGDNYDFIQDTFWNVFRTYAWNHSGKDIEQFVDYCNNTVNRELVPKVWKEILSTFIDNVLAGLMITVSADREILLIPSIIIYLIYFVLLIMNVKKYGLEKTSLFAILVIISTVLNVLIISLVIFNQTRYTIYNMPLFFIAMLLMIYNIFTNNKKELN